MYIFENTETESDNTDRIEEDDTIQWSTQIR